jgi:hypothetical protein
MREGAEQPYQGQVVATLSYIDPSRETLPGDYDAVGLDGRDQALISYGAVYADFKTPQGDALQLGPGRRAQLTVRVPADRTQTPAMLPALMQVWTYNPVTGYWEQEPELATRSGVSYTTEVRHFSTINMDLGTVGNAACVRVEVDFLKTPEDRILQVSTPIPTGGTQVKEATLDEKLNAVFRLLPGSTATFALKRADGTTFSDFALLDENDVEVPGATITLVSPDDDMQGADLWPDSPFDDCRRLVLVSGAFDAPVDFLNKKGAELVDLDTLGQSEAYYASSIRTTCAPRSKTGSRSTASIRNPRRVAASPSRCRRRSSRSPT